MKTKLPEYVTLKGSCSTGAGDGAETTGGAAGFCAPGWGELAGAAVAQELANVSHFPIELVTIGRQEIVKGYFRRWRYGLPLRRHGLLRHERSSKKHQRQDDCREAARQQIVQGGLGVHARKLLGRRCTAASIAESPDDRKQSQRAATPLNCQ